MKLTLSQQELEQAVTQYVTGMINLKEGTNLAVEFRAGRGDNGITAEVDINYLAVDALPGVTGPSPAEVAQAARQQTAATDKGSPLQTEPAKTPDAPAAAKGASKPPRQPAGKGLFGNQPAKGTTAAVDPAPAATEQEPAAEVPVDEQIATYDQAETDGAVSAEADPTDGLFKGAEAEAPAPAAGGERKSLFNAG